MAIFHESSSYIWIINTWWRIFFEIWIAIWNFDKIIQLKYCFNKKKVKIRTLNDDVNLVVNFSLKGNQSS